MVFGLSLGGGGSRKHARKPSLIGDRTIYANNPEENEHFVDNVIITSKYTWYNFVPVFLIEQFSRFVRSIIELPQFIKSDQANFYFLCVSILQSIPQISITNGLPTNFMPLSIVLFFDGIVTAREDYKRHIDDDKANGSETLTLRDGEFKAIRWAEINVGDILKICRNEAVPADCVFLSSYSQDSNQPDTCYVQTAQLDGETNLKLKQASGPTVETFVSDQACMRYRGKLVCEAPHAAFDKFVGMIYLPAGASNPSGSNLPSSVHGYDRPVPLEADQLLLRGSIIRNVDYVYAIVAYTGGETKVRVRQTKRPMKRAQVEHVLNKVIVLLVFMLLTICLIGAIGSAVWSSNTVEKSWYLDPAESGQGNGRNSLHINFSRGLETFFTYFLLNAGFIPVSLYVSVRLARSFQMATMEWDLNMYYEDRAAMEASGGAEGAFPLKVRSMDLNDELGQITHVFSDKTGTLTQNYMEFRKFMVYNVAYGLGATQIGIDRLKREGKDVSALLHQLEKQNNRDPSAKEGIPHVNFEDGSETHPDRTLGSDARNPSDGQQGTRLFFFFLHLALNHSVLRETVRDKSGAARGTRLSASSPDEEAFLYAAQSFGYTFVNRSQDVLLLSLRYSAQALPLDRLAHPLGPQERQESDELIRRAMPQGDINEILNPRSNPLKVGFMNTLFPVRILHALSYSQERKRMSVVVQLPVIDTDGALVLPPVVSGLAPVLLFCKGADSVILERSQSAGQGLPGSPAESNDMVRASLKSTLSNWGNDGLRTLCFSFRPLPLEELLPWSDAFSTALLDLEQIRRRKAKQPNRIDELMDAIEAGLTLQGASANEDKLQEEVPETISKLSQAGIKVWMVTGDKQETAVNIGFATRLLDDSMRQVVATVESAGSLPAALKRIRIASKRLRAERARDIAAPFQSDALMGVQTLYGWLQKGVESLETRLGVTVGSEGEQHTEIDIDAAAAEMTEQAALEAAQEAAPAPASNMNNLFMSKMISIRNVANEAGFLPTSRSTAVQQTTDDSQYTSPQLGSATPSVPSTPLNKSMASVGQMTPRSPGVSQPFSSPSLALGQLDDVAEGTGTGTTSLNSSILNGGLDGDSRGASRVERAFSFQSDEGEEDIVTAAPNVADQMIGHRDVGLSVQNPVAALGLKKEESPRTNSTSASSSSELGVSKRAISAPSVPFAHARTGKDSEMSLLQHSSRVSDQASGRTGANMNANAKNGELLLPLNPLHSPRSLQSAQSHEHAPSHISADSAPSALHSIPGNANSDVRLNPIHSARRAQRGTETERDSADPNVIAHSQSSPSHGRVSTPWGGAQKQQRIAVTPYDIGPTPVKELNPIDIASSLLALPPLLGPQRRPYALIIDEQVLDAAISHPRAKAYLLYLSINCSAVIACRARPDQKAQVVRLIRRGVAASRTLAIGDGANDVDMISNAHVGVGIAGVEGVQAANASDYAIGRFKFLQNLLLVHGRWNYMRMTRLVLYMFWKNIIFVIAQFMFQFYNGFSGQKWYIEYGNQTYNLLFTGLPVLLMAIFDRDISSTNAIRFPKLYDYGRLNRGLNFRIFGEYILDGLLIAMMNAFFVISGFTVANGPAVAVAGSTPYIFMMGTVTFTSVIIIANFRLAVETFLHHWVFQAAVAFSALFWFPALFVFDKMGQDNIEDGMSLLLGGATFWFNVSLVCLLSAAVLIGRKAWQRLFDPQLWQLVQEAEVCTRSFDLIENYCALADLARKTGRSLPEVLEARKIANAAATILPVVAAIPHRLGSGFTAFHQRVTQPNLPKQVLSTPVGSRTIPTGKSLNLKSVKKEKSSLAAHDGRPYTPESVPTAGIVRNGDEIAEPTDDLISSFVAEGPIHVEEDSAQYTQLGGSHDEEVTPAFGRGKTDLNLSSARAISAAAHGIKGGTYSDLGYGYHSHTQPQPTSGPFSTPGREGEGIRRRFNNFTTALEFGRSPATHDHPIGISNFTGAPSGVGTPSHTFSQTMSAMPSGAFNRYAAEGGYVAPLSVNMNMSMPLNVADASRLILEGALLPKPRARNAQGDEVLDPNDNFDEENPEDAAVDIPETGRRRVFSTVGSLGHLRGNSDGVVSHARDRANTGGRRQAQTPNPQTQLNPVAGREMGAPTPAGSSMIEFSAIANGGHSGGGVGIFSPFRRTVVSTANMPSLSEADIASINAVMDGSSDLPQSRPTSSRQQDTAPSNVVIDVTRTPQQPKHFRNVFADSARSSIYSAAPMTSRATPSRHAAGGTPNASGTAQISFADDQRVELSRSGKLKLAPTETDVDSVGERAAHLQHLRELSVTLEEGIHRMQARSSRNSSFSAPTPTPMKKSISKEISLTSILHLNNNNSNNNNNSGNPDGDEHIEDWATRRN